MATEKEKALATFLADVEELKTLVVELDGMWDQVRVKARGMAPRYSPGADGFMALPRLFHEAGELLDGFAADMLDEGGSGADTVYDVVTNMQDLLDLLEVAKAPRKELAA